MCSLIMYKTKNMSDNVILVNGRMLKFVAECYKNQRMCNNSLNNYANLFEFILVCYKI